MFLLPTIKPSGLIFDLFFLLNLSKIFVILIMGQSLIYEKKLFQRDIGNELLPGSTIVVSRNPDPYNWLKLTSIITPILSDFAVSAAAISAISNDN